jgi:polysaccharide biosynthesis/export protein
VRGRIASLGWIVAVLALAAGCASNPASRPPAPPSAPPVAATPAPERIEYVLQTGDVLQIKLYYNPELNELVPIRPDGRISLELAGDMVAAGLTPSQLRERLIERYTRLLRTPEVAVIVKEFSGRKIYVGGEVGAPGVIRPAGNLTALQAIFEAGGFRNTAELRNVVILRNQGTNEPLFMTLDLSQEVKGGHTRNNGSFPSQDITLQSQDIVFVPKTRIARMGQFVDQYFKQLMPIPLTLGLTYIMGGSSVVIP